LERVTTMRVLVVSESKHGATGEIGEAIARTLNANGVDATARDADAETSLSGYDAFVVGSGVYAGHWLKGAREFVAQHAAVLSAHPTWLFSSGPIGEPPKPDEAHAIDVTDVVKRTGAREHRAFAGKLDKAALGFGERAVMIAVRAPEGDYRDWNEIEDWARTIAKALTPGTTLTAPAGAGA
jgi:menaquinone-dependent protoporphyrinogen oxidase